MNNDVLKNRVFGFWNAESCGTVYAQGASEKEKYDVHAQIRYELEPYIHDFAEFTTGKGKDILEIGIGMGADHLEWAKSKPKSLTGVDLTPLAVEHTSRRLSISGLESKVEVADAERLPYDDDSFDLVYSWGVLQHSPDTPKAIDEVYRVLRRGGTAKVMLYHTYSMVGYMLWMRYGLLAGKPFVGLNKVLSDYLQGPGEKAYTVEQAQKMFTNFSAVKIKPQMSFGDLLEGAVGQRHRGPLLSLAKTLYPRWLIKTIFKNHGLYLLITATK